MSFPHGLPTGRPVVLPTYSPSQQAMPAPLTPLAPPIGPPGIVSNGTLLTIGQEALLQGIVPFINYSNHQMHLRFQQEKVKWDLAADEERTALQGDIQRLEAKIAGEQRALGEETERVKELTEENEGLISKIGRQAANLQGQIEALEKANQKAQAKYEADLASKSATVESAEKRLKTSEEAVEELSKKNEELQTDLNINKNAVFALERGKDDAEVAKDEAIADREKLKQELDETRAQFMREAEEQKKLAEELRSCRKQKNYFKKHKDEYLEKLREKRDSTASLQQQLDDARKQAASNNSEVEKLAAEVTTWEKQCEELQQTNAKDSAALRDLRGELFRVREERDESKERGDELEGKNAEVAQALHQKAAELVEERARWKKLRAFVSDEEESKSDGSKPRVEETNHSETNVAELPTAEADAQPGAEAVSALPTQAEAGTVDDPEPGEIVDHERETAGPAADSPTPHRPLTPAKTSTSPSSDPSPTAAKPSTPSRPITTDNIPVAATPTVRIPLPAKPPPPQALPTTLPNFHKRPGSSSSRSPESRDGRKRPADHFGETSSWENSKRAKPIAMNMGGDGHGRGGRKLGRV